MESNEFPELGETFANCPTCKSQDWKSAKLVILEGTVQSEGAISGSITDPSRVAGGITNFFASDRWFSYEHPLEAYFNSVSTTKLAHHIKSSMVSYANKIKKTLVPVEKIIIHEKEPVIPTNPLNKYIKSKPNSWLNRFLILLGLAEFVKLVVAITTLCTLNFDDFSFRV